MTRVKRFLNIPYTCMKHPAIISSSLRKLARGFTFFDFDYNYLKGYSFSPKSVCLILTDRCNLKCIMCDIGQKNAHTSSSAHFPIAASIEKGQTVMALENWKAVMDDIVQKRWNPLILLTGTEPFIYPEVLPLIEYIVKRKLRLHITTNGTLLSRYVHRLVELCERPDSITVTVSLDGIGELHDTIRGVKGTFKKAITGLQEIAEIKRRHKKNWPEVSITYTISHLNYRHMREFALWFLEHDLGISRLTFSHLWFKDEAIVKEHNRIFEQVLPVGEENLTGLRISEIDMDFVWTELETIKALCANAPFSVVEHPHLTYAEAKKYYARTTETVFYDKCMAPWRNVTISPKGEVLITPMCFDYPIGNVREDPFSHIWNGTSMRDFRTRLRRVGMYPACTRCCLLFDSKPKYYKLKEQLHLL